jgi:KDO2-lipid IV(A) lauroyltransferase
MTNPILRTYRFALKSVIRALDRTFHSMSGRRLMWVGDFLGLCFYTLVPKKRRIALFNLDLAFGGKLSPVSKEILTRRMFKNLGRSFAEVVCIDKLGREDAASMVAPKDRKAIEEALGRGRGILVLTAHFGNWGLLSSVFARLGYKVNVLTKPVKDPVVNDFWRSRLEATGMRLLTREDAMKKMLACLRKNEAVALVLDQNRPSGQGVFVDFFGTKASTISALAILAMMSKAPVIPVFLIRGGREPWHHRMECRAPLEFEYPPDGSDAVVFNTQRYTKIIEEVVRRHPEQWIWLHKRWRSRPEGEAPLYPF